ncbi:MAG: hypothetical protein ABWK05_08495 [Pyrobaculum sp.]
MNLAYIKGPPVAIFAGSWMCEKSPVDGTPVALGEPFGDCSPEVARLMSIATTVWHVKRTGVKVYVSRDLGEDGVDAAYAGGADGVVEELKASKGRYEEGAEHVVLQPQGLEELLNAVRHIAEAARRPFGVLVVANPRDVAVYAPYVDGVVLTGGWTEVVVAPTEVLPEVGRCLHCGVDFLMYGGEVRRCLYCGRKLMRVITHVKPPRSRAVFRSVFKKYQSIYLIRFRVV